MGLIKNFFIKRAIRKQVSQLTNKSPPEIALDEYLKETLKRNTEAQKLADKMLKVRMIERSTKSSISKIKELQDEDEDFEDDEDDEEEDDGEDMITKTLTNLILNKVAGGQLAEKNPAIAQAISSLSPAEIEAIKKKFLS